MTTLELVLVLALAGALVTLVVALRRAPESGGDVAELLRSELGRVGDAVTRQSLDDREIRGDMNRVRELVEGLRSATEARVRAEEPVWEAVRRMESVLAGGSSRGQAGENLLEESLSLLPAGMLVRDHSVGGKRCEFALVLPDGKRLPIDSKWASVREIEALEGETDPVLRRALCRRIEDEVGRRAREVETYLDPSMTTPFAVAAIPDPVFAVCRKAHADAYARGVVLVPYSTAMPVVLALYALAARSASSGDVASCLSELDGLLTAMSSTLENKVARATTMLQNASDEWRTQVGKARGALARGRGATGETEFGPEDDALTSAFESSLRAG